MLACVAVVVVCAFCVFRLFVLSKACRRRGQHKACRRRGQHSFVGLSPVDSLEYLGVSGGGGREGWCARAVIRGGLRLFVFWRWCVFFFGSTRRGAFSLVEYYRCKSVSWLTFATHPNGPKCKDRLYINIESKRSYRTRNTQDNTPPAAVGRTSKGKANLVDNAESGKRRAMRFLLEKYLSTLPTKKIAIFRSVFGKNRLGSSGIQLRGCTIY